jgi:hypothetical protein
MIDEGRREGGGWVFDQEVAFTIKPSHQGHRSINTVDNDGSSPSHGDSVVTYRQPYSSYTHIRISTTWITLIYFYRASE